MLSSMMAQVCGSKDRQKVHLLVPNNVLTFDMFCNAHFQVRHGAECFNYIFPQEMERGGKEPDKYLVISKTFEGVPWRYVEEDALQDFLYSRIDEGFTFPLSPKCRVHLLCAGVLGLVWLSYSCVRP